MTANCLLLFCVVTLLVGASYGKRVKQVRMLSKVPANISLHGNSEEEYRTGLALKFIDPIYQATQLTPITPHALQPLFKVFHGKAENESSAFPGPYNQTVCDAIREYVATIKTPDIEHLVIYVHGFKQKWNSTVHLRMRDALFTQKQHKLILIIVDARDGFVLTLYQPLSSYAQAAMNTRTVANEMAQVTNCLTSGPTAPFTLNQTHLIGFSLGGHVAGMAGNIIQTNLTDGQKVARITGLDPAGPWFSREVDLRYKLSADDADFVDVIHTSWDGVWGFGTDETLGHIDFYPQGAQAYMCPPVPIFGASCEHMAAHELFMESIYQHYSCVMKGWRCTSWNHFVAGLCETSGENSVRMGYFLTKEEYLRALPSTLASIADAVKNSVSTAVEKVVDKLPTLPSLNGSTQSTEQLPAADAKPTGDSSAGNQWWQLGAAALNFVQNWMVTDDKSDSSVAEEKAPHEAQNRFLEMLPVVGQFFLSKEESDLNSDNSSATGRGLEVGKSSRKNKYFLHVRRIYPYCVSETEQLRMIQPETCSESGWNPITWLTCASRKAVNNGPTSLIYSFFSAFKSYGNIINADIG